MAVKLSFTPSATLGAGGVIAIDTRVAGVTVRVTLPERLLQTLATLQVAIMVAVPVPSVLTSPLLLTVATAVLEEVQVRSALRSCVELSEKVPVAVNCCRLPSATLGAGGVSAIDTRLAGVTVTVMLAETEPQALATAQVPVMLAVPGLTALILPLLLTVATEELEEVQVRSVVLTSV